MRNEPQKDLRITEKVDIHERIKNLLTSPVASSLIFSMTYQQSLRQEANLSKKPHSKNCSGYVLTTIADIFLTLDLCLHVII